MNLQLVKATYTVFAIYGFKKTRDKKFSSCALCTHLHFEPPVEGFFLNPWRFFLKKKHY